jgi:hypothetical protein
MSQEGGLRISTCKSYGRLTFGSTFAGDKSAIRSMFSAAQPPAR